MRRFGDALERRLHLSAALASFRQSAPEPGKRLGDAPPYSLGRLTLALVFLLFVSGFALAFYYQPTAERATASLRELQSRQPFGGWVRSTHRWSAIFLLAVVGLHALRAWWLKAFRYPRDINWWIGLVLFVLVAMLGATGYLLRWDIKAFSLMDLVITNFSPLPILGGPLIALLLGGTGEGTIPLFRGYAVHLWFLPTLLVLVAGLHVFIVARQGLSQPAVRWLAWRQRWKRLSYLSWAPGVLLLAAVLALSFLVQPAEEPMGPTRVSSWPDPDWLLLFYFLPFWFFKGSTRVIGAFVLPTIVLLFLIAAPRIDTRDTRRWVSAGLTVVGAIAVLFLIGQTARMGARVPIQGCAACHQPGILGGAPDTLSEFEIRDPDWLVFHLQEPIDSILTPFPTADD